MSTKILTICGPKSISKDFIQSLLMSFKARQKCVLFVRKTNCLDIDTPEKDSYTLFEAGLDFSMLVTDKHCYLKSCDDVTQYLPIDGDVDWIIQDGEVYPSDIQLTLTENQQILTDSGKRFPQSPLTHLINWLEKENE
ncbi:MAG: hypothetical protein CSA42_07200 [Gammaproteobacteria bacterium]|nr:MAG: hypothetical protein CSA42_07200 [Gammaproteobacteria bacterium]